MKVDAIMTAVPLNTLLKVMMYLHLALLMSAATTNAFYIPGVNPYSFRHGDEINLFVNSITSIHTQIPKPYYRLPFCLPEDGPRMATHTLGEFITGNKIETSPYKIQMMKEVYCEKICQRTLSVQEANVLKTHIFNKYDHNWIIDNLPSASSILRKDRNVWSSRRDGGFPIGFMNGEDAYIYNHVNIILDYHPVEAELPQIAFRLVDFMVEPMSIKHTISGEYEDWSGIGDASILSLTTCPNSVPHINAETNSAEPQIVDVGERVIFTYDVIWRKSEVHWASRWDIYLTEGSVDAYQYIHWYPMFSNLLMIIVMSAMILSICIRNMKKDRAHYNTTSTQDTDVEASPDHDSSGDTRGGSDDIDTSKWKVVPTDIFLPPRRPILYSVLVSSGCQLTVTFFVTLILFAIGIVNPSRRGSMMNTLLLYFMLGGIVAGYISGRLHKAFHGTKEDLRVCTVYTATMFPGFCFMTFIILNLVALFRGAVSVPISCVIIMALMWCCVTVPLVHLGAYFGFKAEAISLPTAGAIPRPGSVSYWYLLLLPVAIFGYFLSGPIGTLVCTFSLFIMGYKCSEQALSKPISYPNINIALAGMLPFKAIYIELYFIMSSLWWHRYYYVPGLALLLFLVLLTICVGTAVLLTHRSLFNESNGQIATHWRWTVLFASGSVAGYIFLYSIMFFQTLDTHQGNEAWFASILYFGYMSLICVVVFLVTGSVGSIASIFFLRQIISPTPTAPTGKHMKSVDQKSDEPLLKASLLKESTQNERLDWVQNDINELNGVQLDLLTSSLFTCGKCNSTKTTSTQKQTKNKDKPMAVFVFCSNCGHRWQC